MRELRLKRLRLRNFLRFGDKWTEVDLSKEGLVLILGKNGHGKSTLFDAISFALTGKVVRRAVQPGRMVNRVNKKELLVVLDLDIGDLELRIIRGMKPGVCKFYLRPKTRADEGDIEQPAFDRTLDSIARTSAEIERVTRIDHELLVAMIVNSTRRDTFIQAESSVQKATVESLFGFRLLTEKGEGVKAKREAFDGELKVKEAVLVEKRASREATLRQLKSLRDKQAEWDSTKEVRIAAARRDVVDVSDHGSLRVQIAELEELRRVALAKASERRAIAAANPIVDLKQVASSLAAKRESLMRAADSAKEIDFDAELKMHADVAELESEAAILASCAKIARMGADTAGRRHKEKFEAHRKAASTGLECPTCKQRWPDAAGREAHIADLIRASAEASAEMRQAEAEAVDAEKAADSMSVELSGFKRMLRTGSAADAERQKAAADRAAADIDSATAEWEGAESKVALAAELVAAAEAAQLAAETDLLGLKPRLKSMAELEGEAQKAIAAARRVADIEAEANPHAELADSLEAEVPTEADSGDVDRLKKAVEHCLFLERVLIRKDSPIRRAVTSTYLPPLNSQLNKYLSKLGLPYTVEFNDELEPMILDGGDDVDPGAISGGEEERLAMSLSWAFRDAYEEINGVRICFSAIDERLDSGLDVSGAELAVAQLRETSLQAGRSVWLVTHKKEFEDHADHVLEVDRGDGRFSDVGWREAA